MKDLSLNEVQNISKKIVKDIDKICRENGIRYTIIGGTLIGAIRHSGFIPWDDDIDIAMKREDYEKFIDVYNKEKNKIYLLLHNKFYPEYYYPFAKVCDTRTCMYEENMNRIEGLGVCVDVFPVDEISSKKLPKRLRKLVYCAKGQAFRTTNASSSSKIRNIIKTLIYPAKFESYLKIIDKEAVKENNNVNTDLAGVLVCGTGEKDIFPKHIFDEYVDLQFEDMELMSVKLYNVFLEHRFGDYMKLPPKEEQVSHHVRKIYWKE